MPSIFHRSTSKRNVKAGGLVISEPRGVVHAATLGGGHTGKYIQESSGEVGEFGALPSGAVGARHLTFASPPSSPHASFSTHTQPPAPPCKYTFLPTYLPPHTSSDNSIDSTHYSDPDIPGQREYGYLGGVGGKVILGLEEVKAVVVDVAKELEGRGVATVLLFSSGALEGNMARARLLVQAYVDMLSSSYRPEASSSQSKSFSHDLQYAKEHELAWFLRWALSRIARRKEGTREISRGIIEWEVYEEWRGRERAASYPTDAFPYLSALLPPSAYSLLQPLFHLLSRLAAHSHLSGLTPHALSSLFAPLLFDVPVHSPALASHTAFVRAASATEHILLAYIRSTSRSADLGLNDLPLRLNEWVAGYPGMVVSDTELVRGLPRKGARVIRCERATRVVRAYSKDLVATAETWAGQGEWPAWERVVLRSKRGDSRPKFTGGYRRKMVVKETPALPASAAIGEVTEYGLAEMGSSAGAMRKGARAYDSDSGHGRQGSDEEGRYGSLAGKEWSMFEEGGFGSEGQNEFGDKLRFDLTESAKMSVIERRKTMDWTDFASSSGGFTRTDPALTTTLTFSPPLAQSIESWPKERTDLSKRLHKSNKDSVPFHHDTTAKFGEASGWSDTAVSGGGEEKRDGKGRVYLEEAFLDFWADLGLGGGWVDRAELTFRESSWAILEYKAKPSTEGETHAGPGQDPRTSSLYFLFEEKVPYDYQLAIANPSEKRAFSLFTRKKKQPSIPKSASAGVGGGLTLSASALIAPQGEFDRMLLSRSGTKKVTLSGNKGSEASIWHKQTGGPLSPSSGSPTKVKTREGSRGAGGGGFVVKSRPEGGKAPVDMPVPVTAPGLRQEGKTVGEKEMGGTGREEGEGKKSLFGLSKSGKAGRGRADEDAVEAEVVDYELQSASGVGSPDGGSAVGRDEDKWMDILVSNGARRMDRQSPTPARLPPPPTPAGALSPSPLPTTQSRKSRTPSPRYSPERLPPAIYHSPDASAETEDELHTPRAPNFIPLAADIHLEPSVDAESGVPPLPPPREPKPLFTRKPLPSPAQQVQYIEGDQNNQSGQQRDSWSSGSDRPNLHAPSPRRGRDTIHNIVDTYRDSDISTVTDADYDDTGRYSRVTEDVYASDGEGGEEEGRRRYSSERGSQAGSEGMEELSSPTKGDDGSTLEPPKPIFDLTPTREPSPGRYRHGEALHFVREEAEEEYR